MEENTEKKGLRTAPFRLAFPAVFKPKAFEGGEAKFTITMLFPKSGNSLIPSLPGSFMDLRREAYRAAVEEWGVDQSKWPPTIQALDFKTHVSLAGKDGWPIRDGDTVSWDGFAGMWFVRATTKFPPSVVDNTVHEILRDDAVFGGLICRAYVSAFAYDSPMNKGISFGFQTLQTLEDDGVRFGGFVNPKDVFSAYEPSQPATAAGSGAPW